MRITYLTQPYPPMVSGASILAEQLAQSMARRGHEVLVIAASDTGRRYSFQKDNLTVLRLESFRNPARANQRLLRFPGTAVMQALQDFKPDLIHAHEPFHSSLLGLKYARQAHIPVLYTSHQLPWFIASYMPNLPGLRRSVESMAWNYARWLAGQFTAILSPTKTISNILREKTGLKSVTIPYGIDPQVFDPSLYPNAGIEVRQKYNIPAGASIILHVGRLDTDKGVDKVIRAAAKVIGKSEAHLLVVGDGSQRSTLENLCKGLGLESRVHFTGFITNKFELAKVYTAANVFVSASEIETQGIVFLEAAACGSPIAAVDATCISEVVHHGENGLLAEPGNIPALSHAIEKILRRPDCARRMQINALQLAKGYDLESSFDKHEKYYQFALGLTRQKNSMPTSARSAFKGKSLPLVKVK